METLRRRATNEWNEASEERSRDGMKNGEGKQQENEMDGSTSETETKLAQQVPPHYQFILPKTELMSLVR
ncbi:unnamed protein product [Litomosoides sigmodontis]|uniref:Uncharacterized protein n=1 Tax=Litomosoides sigmodontis TaxID=42156 RepID=A0A3P6SGB8_LITSI|nr:unnamed protein product [Litomosoides sigmodontis]